MTTPTPTQTIRLRRGAQFWEADFSETAQADQVRELFGTCVLPTPWATTADGYDVAMRLSYKNPGVSIVVEQLTAERLVPPPVCRSCGEAYQAGKGFDGECARCRSGRDEATERRLLYGAKLTRH